MASKAIYKVAALAAIALVGAASWWFQNQPAKPPAEMGGPASQGTGGPANAKGAAVASGGPGAVRPPSVEVAAVEVSKLVDETQAVGSLRSRQGVILRPEVSGRITQLNFRDGDRVKKGQLLIQFDDQLPMAQVQQAQAELSIALANNKRNQELVEQNFISRRAVDESAANLQVAEAKLSLARATAARLKIVSPFDGIAGIRTVSVGDYLKDGADIVNIEDMEAIFVDYRLPERFQAKVRRGQVAAVELDALPGRKFSATVQAIDPLIDANGRSVGVRACIDNRRLQLRPGMFARVNTVFGQRNDARIIPEEAIVPQGGRQFVIKVVAGPDGQSRVSQRVEVKVGLRTPGKVEILEGLDVGDSVIVAGQQRVQKDGIVVRVVDVPPAGARPGPVAPGGAGAPAGLNASSAPGAPGAPSSAAGARPAATPERPQSKALAPLTGQDPCLSGDAKAASEGRPAGRPGRAPA